MPWQKVIFAQDRDEDDCPVCGIDYSECPCPGPTMDDHEYKMVVLHDGNHLFARPKSEADA